MTHIDDEYKNRFKDQELPNDGFDNEGLWDAISEDLDNEEPKNDGKKRFIWFLLFFFGLGIMGTAFYFNSNSHSIAQKTISEKTNEFINENTNINEKPINNSNINSNNKVIEKIGSDLNSSPRDISTSQTDKQSTTQNDNSMGLVKSSSPEKTNTKRASNKATNSESNLSKEQKDEMEIALGSIASKNNDRLVEPSELVDNFNSTEDLIVESNNNQIKSAKTAEHSVVEEIEEKASVSLPIKSSETEGLDSSTQTVKVDPILQDVEADKSTQIVAIDTSSQNVATDSATELVSIDTSTQKVAFDTTGQMVAIDTTALFGSPKANKKSVDKDISWQVAGWGGLNILNMNFNPRRASDFGEFKKQSESGAEFGKSFGISTAIVWKQKWFLNSGLEYHELWSKLDFEEVTNIQVLKEDELVKVWRDGTTGDIVNTKYEDVLVDAEVTRKVIHHNKYQRFSIPIEFGLQKRKSNLVYGIAAGGVLNFTTSQSGKTLDKNAGIIEFDKDSSAAPFKSFTIGLRLSSFVAYRFTKKLSLNISPQLNLVPFGEFDGTDIRLNTQQFNLNVGIGYSFD